MQSVQNPYKNFIRLFLQILQKGRLNMKHTYLTNCEYIQDRNGNEKTRDVLKQKFKSVSSEIQDGFNGNIAAHFQFDRKTKKASAAKKWTSSDETKAEMYQAIPSALALYRLCAFDAGTVQAAGPDGYKCVWSMSFEHVESNTLIVFGEHKGAFSFWMRESNIANLDKGLVKDLTNFLTYMVSDTFAHPYDGLIAGSVA